MQTSLDASIRGIEINAIQRGSNEQQMEFLLSGQKCSTT